MQVTQPYIKLDQFLKVVGMVGSGGQAKFLIQDGSVRVNGVVETRRGRKLIQDDEVHLAGQTFKVSLDQVLEEDA